jgi:hypothetical protein
MPGRVAQPGHDSGFANLSGRSDLAVTIAAINRFVTTRLEGNFGSFAALGTSGGEHLAFATKATTAASEPLGLPCLTALGTPFGLISITLSLEELLVLGAERERRATIGTC